MEPLLIANGLTKSFGTEDEKQIVLDQVSLEIGEGEFVSIMGPSGCGKSTLLYAVSGMDLADRGSVEFAGCTLGELTDEKLSDLRRREMGFVFQQPTFLKNLNILDNILLPMVRENSRDIPGLAVKAKGLMKKAGISELADREITRVSGGQLQRAGICRALMGNPRIIFGDEPTGALNSKSAQEIMELLRQINEEGTAVLLVTHDVNVASATDRVLFMQDGKIRSQLRFSRGEERAGRTEKIMETMRRMEI